MTSEFITFSVRSIFIGIVVAGLILQGPVAAYGMSIGRGNGNGNNNSGNGNGNFNSGNNNGNYNSGNGNGNFMTGNNQGNCGMGLEASRKYLKMYRWLKNMPSPHAMVGPIPGLPKGFRVPKGFDFDCGTNEKK